MKKTKPSKTTKRSRLIRKIQAEKRGAGKRNITFRLDEELVDSFSEVCSKEGVSMNEAVKHLILDFIE